MLPKYCALLVFIISAMYWLGMALWVMRGAPPQFALLFMGNKIYS